LRRHRLTYRHATKSDDNAGILVFWRRRSWWNSNGLRPCGGAKYTWGRKNWQFSICVL